MAWTSGPNLILQAPSWPLFCGRNGQPWSTSSNIYVAVTFYSDARYYRIYKSLDSLGSSWSSVLDFPNAYSADFRHHFNPTDGVIASYYQSSSSNYKITEFDTNTDTVIDKGVAVPASFSWLTFKRFGTDDYIFIYSKSGNSKIYGRRFTTVFGDEFEITSVNATPINAVIDGTSIYILYRENTSGDAKIAKLISDNTVEWSVTVNNELAVPSDPDWNRILITPQNEFVVNLVSGIYSGPVASDATFTKAPATTTPVEGQSQGFGLLLDFDGNVWESWNIRLINWVGEVGTVAQDSVMVRQYLGNNVWGSEIEGLDFVDHPPNVPPGYELPEGQLNYSHANWAVAPISVGFGIVTDFYVNDTNVTCTLYYAGFTAEPETIVPLTPDEISDSFELSDNAEISLDQELQLKIVVDDSFELRDSVKLRVQSQTSPRTPTPETDVADNQGDSGADSGDKINDCETVFYSNSGE